MEEKGTTLKISHKATFEMLAVLEVQLETYKRCYAEYSEASNEKMMDYYKGRAERLEGIVEQIYTQHPYWRPRADEDEE